MSPAFRNSLASEEGRVHLFPALPFVPTEARDPGLIQTLLPAPYEALVGQSFLWRMSGLFSNSLRSPSPGKHGALKKTTH